MLGLALLVLLAGDTVSGRVVDQAGSPIPAAVQLVELHRTTLAGRDGAFALPEVPAGRYTLVVRHLGFTPVVRAVEVADDQGVATGGNFREGKRVRPWRT